MEFNNIYDTHTHSVNSFDAKDSCIKLCEGAVEKGARGIAITDHLDIDGNGLDIRGFTTNQFMQCEIAKDIFKHKLEVFSGIELGQGIYRKEESEKVLNTFNYDFILGSIHNLENVEDFYYMDFRKEDIKQRLTDYFNSVLELAKWDKTDSIAHLTYPLRYIKGKYGIDFDLSDFNDTINEIFEVLIKNHKALELNVSSLFNYQYDTMPNISLIKRFHDMGGKYITVGSDAHSFDKVAHGIDRGYELLLEAGIKHVTVYRKREPFLIEIA